MDYIGPTGDVPPFFPVICPFYGNHLMGEMINFTHTRLLGHLMLLLVFLLSAVSVYLAAKNRDLEGGYKIFASIVTGLLDLQVLLGFGLFFVMGLGWSQLLYHPLFMVVGTGLVHTGNKIDGWNRTGAYALAMVLLLVGWSFHTAVI